MFEIKVTVEIPDLVKAAQMLADKLDDVFGCGLWAGRLLFTTESPRECVMVTLAYQGQNEYRPNGLTRGLYYRGVE